MAIVNSRAAIEPKTGKAAIFVNETIHSLIRKLFANNEQGFAYDPNDLTTMFQDAAGTVPVTGVGQPVGLIKDKSGRGNHASQTTSAARPILRQNAVTGAYYLEFDGADDHLIVPKGNLRFLHDGSGASGFISFTSQDGVYNTLLNTGNLAQAVAVGYALAQDNRSAGRLINVISNGSGTLLVNNSVAVGYTPNSCVVSFKNKTGTHELRRNGLMIISSGSEVGAPSQEVSTNDLWIGRALSGLTLKGRIYNLLVVSRLTTENETSMIELELAKRAGV